MEGPAHYLRALSAFVVALLALLAGFNAFIDPYGNFPLPKIAGVNELALGFNHHLLLAKSLAVSRLRPATVILGNSRAETSYDPQHPGFTYRPAYNLGIGGAGVSEARRYFLEALATGKLREVVLGLDLTMFAPPLMVQRAAPDAMLLTDESGERAGDARRWRRLAFILLSGTTTSDSWWSLTHQRKPVAVYLSSGLRESSSDDRRLVLEGGHRAASLRAEANFLVDTLRDVRSESFRASYAATLAEFREMLALAAERNVRLTIVLNPIHARHTYVFAAAGLWPAYENWKRDITDAVAQSPRQDLLTLWDFSGVSACTSEPVPPSTNTADTMRWYRESAHFRLALGDLVLDRVLEGKRENDCSGLGKRLLPSTLAATLAEQRVALRRWAAGHPDDVAEIDALAKRYARGPAPLP